MDDIIVIPRLILMVRRLTVVPHDSQQTVETLTFAQSLLNAPSKIMIERWIKDHSETANSTINPLGSCIEYSDDEVFILAGFYNMSRIIICGIVQRIFDWVGPALSTQYFDRDKVETEDVEAAQKIAMSTDYAFRKTLTPPFKAMRIFTPLMISYGAWLRLQKRLEGGDPDALKHAIKMKEFASKCFNRSASFWHLGPYVTDKIEEISEAHAGGNTMPILSHKR